MGTPISVPIELFLKKIERDKHFFQYYDMPDDAAMELAIKRAKTFLDEAIGRVLIECQPEVDFLTRTEEGNFIFDWTSQEKILIPSLMYEAYLNRDFAYLKTLSVNYTSTNLKVFDPSNARATFLDMYNKICEENRHLIDRYKNTNRLTGQYKSVNFSDYDF